MQESIDEKNLVQQVRDGNHEAFRVLVKQYERLVLHIINPMFPRQEDREDVCQEIFIKVWQKLYTYQFKSRLGTWIGQVAFNTGINYLKKKKINLDPMDATLIENQNIVEVATGFAEEIIIRSEELDILMQCIERLPYWQKTTIVLFYQDEMSLDEISNMLDIPLNTVKSHLHRAKASLREMMEKLRSNEKTRI